MAKKNFNLQDDVVFTTSRVSEQIRFVSGTMGLTGTLNTGTVDSPHIQTYQHFSRSAGYGGYYQGVFDKDPVSPASNHLFDLTYGVSISSSVDPGGNVDSEKKRRVYRRFAQQLLGNINEAFSFQGQQRDELIFICLDRNQFKDGIKPSTFSIECVFSGNISELGDHAGNRTYGDPHAIVEETPGGTRAALSYMSEVHPTGDIPDITSEESRLQVGSIYYQAGVIVLIPEAISSTGSTTSNEWFITEGGTDAFYEIVAKAQMDDIVQASRQRILLIEFRNQTNIRSTFYTCVADREEFNYSSNPSFINQFGQIITTSGTIESPPRTYITRIGLLGQNDELIATAQLSRPVRNDPDLRVEIKVRLDY